MVEMTAVDWLQNKLPSLFEHDDNDFYKKLFEQAKEMEKNNLNIARLDGINLANKGYGK